jgi:hypothetical protein
VNDAGQVIEQENHYDPRAVTHPQKFRDITRSYFNALASDNPDDLKHVPWADTVQVRAPLYPGGAEVEFVGRPAMEAYLKPFLPVIGTVDVLLNTIEGEWICTKANIGLPDAANPASRIRVTDCFRIDLATGKIVEQENHYDPRPALPRCTSCGGWRERHRRRGCSSSASFATARGRAASSRRRSPSWHGSTASSGSRSGTSTTKKWRRSSAPQPMRTPGRSFPRRSASRPGARRCCSASCGVS